MYSSSKYTVLTFTTTELNKFLSNYNAHPTDIKSTSNTIWQTVFCIVTHYRQDGPGIEFQYGDIFRVIHTSPKAHPVSCTIGTRSFPGVKTASAWC